MVGDAPESDEAAPEGWISVYRSLSAVEHSQLSVADLEQLAVAAYLLGHDDISDESWEAAYARHLAAGDAAEASRCAFWLALSSMLGGRAAHASGWIGRAQTAIADEQECAASGFLLIPQLLGALESGDPAGAAELATRAHDIGVGHRDLDLVALATLGRGQAEIAAGELAEGLGRLDEVMLAVEAGRVGPIASGIVYCAVILECMQVFDLARAAEWTDALDAWCNAQPGLVPYRGQCLIHQSQLRQAAGDWDEALATAELARQRLSDPPHPALGLAHYQEAELLRVRGSLEEAEAAYGRAREAGHEPAPGLALLLLARGDVDSAVANIRRLLAETHEPFRRTGLVSAAVEILRAAGEIDAATEAADELEEIAQRSTSEVVRAMAAAAMGSVHLENGDAAAALHALRIAASAWQRLAVPYEAARTRVLVGSACAALGDDTTASLEFAGARSTFESLGAAADLAALTALIEPPSAAPHGSVGAVLSARELEVLSHVAAGRTGPEIADVLSISHHTVRRHLENVFAKLGVNSRAAAIAFAYENELL